MTSKCPCACQHCSAKERPGGTPPASFREKAIDELTALGVALLGFTGGEPMCRGDLPALIARAKERGMETILFTTGVHQDDAGHRLCVMRDSGESR